MYRTLILMLICLACIECNAGDITGEQIVEQMHRQYHGKWHSTLSFTQTTMIYKNDTLATKETWYEAIQYPKNFRMDFGDPAAGNTALFRNDSLYYFKNKELKIARPQPNDLLFLLGGMYFYPLDSVKHLFKSYQYDLNKGYETRWKGKPVYVIGAADSSDKAKQLWIDKGTKSVLRMLEEKDGVLSEGVFENHIRLKQGWTETMVSFYKGGHLEQREYYHNCKAGQVFDQKIFYTQLLHTVHWNNK